MGGKNPRKVGDNNYLGGWGQFSAAGYSDAGRFSDNGGTEAQYDALTPEQQAQYAEILRPGGENGHMANQETVKAFIAGLGAPGAAGTGAGTPPASDAQLYAQLLGQTKDAGKFVTEQRLDPTWNHREEGMRTRLLNQGLDPTSEASQNAMGQFGRDRNDAYASAINGAQDSAYRNALNTWMAQQNVNLGIGNQQQSNSADVAAAIAQASGPAAKALMEAIKNAQASSGGANALGYDAGGTPYYSEPTDWNNPYGGY